MNDGSQSRPYFMSAKLRSIIGAKEKKEKDGNKEKSSKTPTKEVKEMK